MVSIPKTRLAPTPSGYLHLGNLLSFAVTSAIAAREGAAVLLRIDDMDRDRVEWEFVQDIFDSLAYLQIPYTEGPSGYDDFKAHYSQRHRLSLYNDALQKLREEGHLFACACSRADVWRASADGSYPGTCKHKGLSFDTPGITWRLHTDEAATVTINNLYGNIVTTPLPNIMRDFVVRKKDGFPAYQLASLADDLYYNVNIIVRGADLWDSTLAQLYLAQQLGGSTFCNAAFYHHELLHNQQGVKLSKSAGDTSLQYMRNHGATPTDIYGAVSALLPADAGRNSTYALAGEWLQQFL
jgi:glutamyl/glutaminyl-tRNA synthetase